MYIPHVHLRQTFRVILFECLALIIVFIMLANRSKQPKNSFAHVTGKITNITNNWGILVFPDTAGTRYIKLNDHPLPFDINVDKTSTNIYQLKIGDTITVWYDPLNLNENATIDRNLEYIDKGKKQIYKPGDAGIEMAEFMVCLLLAVIFLAGYLYKRGKIPF